MPSVLSARITASPRCICLRNVRPRSLQKNVSQRRARNSTILLVEASAILTYFTETAMILQQKEALLQKGLLPDSLLRRALPACTHSRTNQLPKILSMLLRSSSGPNGFVI